MIVNGHFNIDVRIFLFKSRNDCLLPQFMIINIRAVVSHFQSSRKSDAKRQHHDGQYTQKYFHFALLS